VKRDGIFASDGMTLYPMATVGDSTSGGGIIDTIVNDFAFSGGVLDIIASPSRGLRVIYSIDATGLSKIIQFGESATLGGTYSTIFFVSR